MSGGHHDPNPCMRWMRSAHLGLRSLWQERSVGLHLFWHRAGWLVFLLLCQSSSSFILQRLWGRNVFVRR